jgi:hypothetical protein
LLGLTNLIVTLSGWPAEISVTFALRLWITSSAFCPKRGVLMPATTSPSPFS